MLQLINGLPSLLSQVIEPYPNQKRAANVIALNSRFATLTGLKPGSLLALAVQLLPLPTEATHIRYIAKVTLSSLFTVGLNGDFNYKDCSSNTIADVLKALLKTLVSR